MMLNKPHETAIEKYDYYCLYVLTYMYTVTICTNICIYL